jgi:SAM-dependent methyltransferase
MRFAPLVRIYESRLWRRGPFVAVPLRISFEREYAKIVEAADLSRAEAVLDLACGPGIYARRFARALPGACVVGMDLSRPMLAHASRLARAEGLRTLRLVRGDALRLPFASDRFDVVNCCGALHLFPDVDRALAEMARVLRPGGRLTLAAFRRGEGAVARARARLRRRLYGLDAFGPAELARRLVSAGLEDPRSLHAAGIWLMLCARKPGVRSARLSGR